MESRGAIETGPLNFRVHAVQRNPVFSIDRSKFSSMIELLFERVYIEREEKEREREAKSGGREARSGNNSARHSARWSQADEPRGARARTETDAYAHVKVTAAGRCVRASCTTYVPAPRHMTSP